ncbi:hypothetical protein [Aeromonas jandaei]|uniref:hypothetical protein n=1 Tax=Aeromonas jandaei TaxID=650 RepID=UPI003EC757A6
MKKLLITYVLLFFSVIGSVFTLALLPVAYGADTGQANLIFHMALSNQGAVEVHATVENTGGFSIDRGYIVISSRDAQCKSNGDVLQPFFNIPVGGRIPVVITLPSGSSGYLVTSFQAFDSFNFPVLTHDETAKIIKEREADTRRKCELNRGVVAEK